jgi:hypothetical protein
LISTHIYSYLLLSFTQAEDYNGSILLEETSSAALVSTTVYETFGASSSHKRFLKWEDTCTIMNRGTFQASTYTFLMDFANRKDTDINFREPGAKANTMLFDGETTTTCKADNKKYRWAVISMCSNSYCSNETDFLIAPDDTEVTTKGKIKINF